MGIASNDSVTGKPIYNNTPQTLSDLQKAADFAEFIGVGRVATFSALSALPYQPVGLVRIVDADGFPYLKKASGWVRLDKAVDGAVPLTLLPDYDKHIVPYKADAYTSSGRVYLKGLCRNVATFGATAGLRYVLGSVPEAWAPSSRLRFPVASVLVPAVLEVTETGEIAYWLSTTVSGAPGGAWNISLSGVDWQAQ